MPTYQLDDERVAEVVVNHGHYRIRYGQIGAKEILGEVNIKSVRMDIDNLSRGIYDILAELAGVDSSLINLISNIPDANLDVLDHQSPLGRHQTLKG